MSEPENGLEFIKNLRERNSKERQSFLDYTRFLSVKARKNSIPISGQFELTPLCNFSCKMCYVHLTPNQMDGHSLLPVSVWKKLMREAWEAGMIQATLTGGECLTYPGFDDLYLYLQSMGCSVTILTNGFLLNDNRIRFFKKHTPNMIQITLYGWNDDVYERVTGQRAFKTVVENARRAIDAGLTVSLAVTPSVYLGEDVLETIRIAKNISSRVSINSSLFSPVMETGRSDQQDDLEPELYLQIYRLMDELEGRETREIDEERLPPVGNLSGECVGCGLRCGGGRFTFGMTWKGMMTICNRMNMIQSDPLKEGFLTAWKTINEAARNWPRVPECMGCPYDSVCNNCAANMLQYTEPGKQPKALCERTKFFVKHGAFIIPECN